MANTDPLRLRVLKNLTAALNRITKDNGYNSDVGPNVFRGRLIFGEGDSLPLVSILEAPIPDVPIQTPRGGTTNMTTWSLLLQGFVEDYYQTPTDPAHILMADVKRVLAEERAKGRGREPNILSMGVVVDNLEVGAGVVRPPEEHASEKANFWLSVTITLVEKLDDPYA